MTKAFKSLIVLMGLPSSGKSTIARLLAKEISNTCETLCIIIGTDDIRRLIPSQLENFNPELEPFIKNATLHNIEFCLKNEYLVINDDMNYYKSMRHELKELAEQNNAHFIIIHIQISLQTALKWNKKRGSPIPDEVIKRVHDRFDAPGDYAWDNPHYTIQSDKVNPQSAVKAILPVLIPIINHPPTPPNLPTSSTPGINEAIDKLTRKIITEFARSHPDPLLMKRISAFRKDFIKNFDPVDKSVSLDSISLEFSQKLKQFVSNSRPAT